MTTVTRPQASTGAEVVARVTELAAAFRARSPMTEAERTVPRETIDELLAAGVARLLVPRERGGLDQGVRDVVDVTVAAAAGCPSTGWIAGLMAMTPHTVASFSLAAQQAVWADGPDVVCAGGLAARATQVPGGYLVSGASPFSSGILNADWVYLIGAVLDDGRPTGMRLFLIPEADYTVEDTWHTAGMRGTGSNTVHTDRVFVADEFTLDATDAREGTTPGAAVNSSPLAALPFIVTGPIVFAAAMIGAARGAYVDAVAALAGKRTPAGGRAADSEHLQIQVASAAARIDAAERTVHAMAARADTGAPFTLAERATAMRDGSFAATLVVEAVDILVAITGTAAFGASNPVQQAWRDIHFAAAHQGLSLRGTHGHFGRIALGIDDVDLPMFY